MSVQGVVALLIDNHGEVLSNSSDFDAGGYGGFTKKHSQTIRVKDALYCQFCQDFLPAFIFSKIDQSTKERIVRDLIDAEKVKIHYEYIGYEENEA